MKIWAEFYDYLLPDLPGCPYVAMGFALRQSAITFCEQSRAWRYQLPDIEVVNDVDTYAYITPAETLVHVVTYAEFNDLEIDATTKDKDMLVSDWRHQTGVPKYVLGTPTGVQLVPKPDLPGTLKLTVALKPDSHSTGIDDDIFQEYREAISHGAKARLMLSPNKPYTKPELASWHMQQFMALTSAAGARVARNYTNAPLQTAIMRR